MGTLGIIAIKENDKNYKYIYNCMDSYIDVLGVTLYRYYQNEEKVRQLIDLGDTSSVGYIIEEGGNETYMKHMNQPSDKRGTVAHFRDCNRWKMFPNYTWEESQPKFATLSELLKHRTEGYEYIYIYNTENNKWYIASEESDWGIEELERVIICKFVDKNVVGMR